MSILIIVITIIGAMNAIFRYAGRYLHYNLSSNIFIELQWYLFSIIFLMGASVTFSKDEHIRVDVFFNKFSARKKRRFNLLGTVFLLIPFCGFLVYLSSLYFLTSFEMLEQSTEPNGLPRYVIKFFIPVSFALLLANAIYYFIKLINKQDI